MNNTFTIGTDSEFFVKNTAGKYISAIPFVSGTKHRPKLIPGGNVQRDNVALEVATDVSRNMAEFVGNVGKVLAGAMKIVPDGHFIEPVPSAEFPEDQLDHPEARMFGCDPDFDAYRIAMNNPPVVKNPLFRSCGGHIHVGHADNPRYAFLKSFDGKIDMVKAMDVMHGIIATILDHSEASVKRRELYGKAGTHRPKPEYGVEYRVLSNFWVKSPGLVELMYSLTLDALELVAGEKVGELIDAIGQKRLERTINEGLVEEASDILEINVKQHLSQETMERLEKAVKENERGLAEAWQIAGKGAV